MIRAFTMAAILALAAGVLALASASAQGDPVVTLWLPYLGHNAVLGPKGDTVSSMNVQNLGRMESATVVADYYKQSGEVSIPINRPPILPLTAASLYLPTEPGLPGDGIYAGIVDSDRRVAAVARTEWQRGQGAALYGSVTPSTRVIVPLFVRGIAGQRSYVVIHNTDEQSPAHIVAKIFRTGESRPVTQVSRDISRGTSWILDILDFVLAGSFLGSVTVESATPVGVMSFVDFETSEQAVYAFEGVPAELAAATLYAPLFRNNFYGTTGISVVNPGSRAVQATVTFAGTLGNCVGQSYQQGPANIAAGSSVVFYQDNVAVTGTGVSPLPRQCAGSATIAATGPVLAIVNDASGNPASPTTSAAYNAMSREQGARRVALPLYRKRHGPAQLTTGIQAMNVDTDTARVSITFVTDNGIVSGGACGGACQVTIAPGASANWYPPTISSLPPGKYGSAIIESDQRLVVIVNDVSLNGLMDTAIYNGIKADEP